MTFWQLLGPAEDYHLSTLPEGNSTLVFRQSRTVYSVRFSVL